MSVSQNIESIKDIPLNRKSFDIFDRSLSMCITVSLQVTKLYIARQATLQIWPEFPAQYLGYKK